jgi:hypothetical protein
MDFTRTENTRRSKFRFGIEREVRYKMADRGVVVAFGTGRTVNLGSGGVAFTCEQELTPGGFIELSISWPVLLDEICPMRLIAFGRVLRCKDDCVACTIDKYEFRTQSRNLQSISAPRSDGMLKRWADGVIKEMAKSEMTKSNAAQA